MFNINFQLLAHVKDFRLLTPRQASFYQLRLSVFQQPTMKNKKTQQLIPYLILTPQQNKFSIDKQQSNNQSLYQNNKDQDSSITGRNIKQHSQPAIMNSSQQRMNLSQSFQRINSLQVEYHNNKNSQLGQIDSQTNSYLTKPFLVQKVDHVIGIDEVVVFKGAVEISLNDMLELIVKHEAQKLQQQQMHLNSNEQNHQNKSSTSSSKQPKFLLSHLLTSLYVSCQLFLVSSYSTQSIGQWAGYTLTDQGNVLLPVSFFAYNSSYSLIEMTFLWTKIDFLSHGKENTMFLGKNGQEQVKKIEQFLTQKYNNLSNNILNLPKQYNHYSSHAMLFIKRKDNTTNQLDHLLHILSEYNEKTHSLWKTYQQFIQQTILSKGKLKHIVGNLSEQKLLKYKQTLKLYHWKHHIQLNQSHNNNNGILKKQLQQNDSQQQYSKLFRQLDKIKSNPSIDRQLVFYPFSQHQRTIKINNQDLIKTQKINSLSLSLNSNTNNQQKPKYHLLIFVHGYQASSYDMQNLACYLKYKQPQRIKTFISSCNQGRTQQPIQESGHRLAIEIKNYINNKFQCDKEQIQISFICHSMGGLIVRAALKYLQLYKNKFKTYLSLCSPHLGYLYHSSALIKTSLWVLNQVKKDPSMIELSMQDNPVLEKTYLYELSKKPQLQWFKYPIFIGSRQDEYVPFWSALVQDKQFYFQTKDAKIYKQLYKNLTQHLQNKIIRLQTVYQDKIHDISSFVGRTAHIRILNCIEVMEMIYLLVEGAF